MSRVKAKKKYCPKASKDEYVIPPKQKEWFDKKLVAYKTFMDKSVDDEAVFEARSKEILKLGRQCAKDRLRAGQILIDMEWEIKSIGYPFWPWLAVQFDERVPERTARRAMDIARHFETVAELGDRTITEALKEVQEAKAKKAESTAKARPKDQDEEEGEDSGTGEEGKEGKKADNVSDGLPNPPGPKPAGGAAADEGEESIDNDDDGYTQDDLQWDVDQVRELIEEIFEHMAGDLGDFKNPNEIIEEIDYSIDLLNQIKATVPM